MKCWEKGEGQVTCDRVVILHRKGELQYPKDYIQGLYGSWKPAKSCNFILTFSPGKRQENPVNLPNMSNKVFRIYIIRNV